MPTPNKIAEHRDRQPDLEFGAWQRYQWLTWGNAPGLLPDPGSAQGEIHGSINYGRNMAECPLDGTAYVVNADEALFLCHHCANIWNRHQYARIVWPRDIESIRNVLARRPAVNIQHAPSRNWTPDESLADVKRHNREHRDDDDDGPPPATLEALAAA